MGVEWRPLIGVEWRDLIWLKTGDIIPAIITGFGVPLSTGISLNLSWLKMVET
jgi:hypothetical protein